MSEGASIESVAAALRQDGGDLALYAGFLLNDLSAALPPDVVRVERERTLKDKMKGREGTVVELGVALGDREFVLRRAKVGARPVATICHRGAGIILSSKEVSLDQWSSDLAAGLVELSRSDARAAQALAQISVTKGSDL